MERIEQAADRVVVTAGGIIHDIPLEVFEKVRGTLRTLFALDNETKRELQVTPDNYRGFIPLGFFTPNRVEANGDRGDQYEGYKLHWECPPDHPAMAECDLYGPNRWPAALPESHLRGLANQLARRTTERGGP